MMKKGGKMNSILAMMMPFLFAPMQNNNMGYNVLNEEELKKKRANVKLDYREILRARDGVKDWEINGVVVSARNEENAKRKAANIMLAKGMISLPDYVFDHHRQNIPNYLKIQMVNGFNYEVKCLG